MYIKYGYQKVGCSQSVLVAVIYFISCHLVSKITSTKILKAIIIGFITPFFSYYFIKNFIHIISYFLYLTKLYDPSIAILLISITAKPLSIIIGLMTMVLLLTKKNLIKQLQQDIFNLFKN